MDTTQISRRQILVVGSCNTDMVIKAAHLPRPGETILGGTFFMNPGGKGANQAVAIARLGGSVTFICKTGSDIFGHQSQQLFEEEGINTSYVFSRFRESFRRSPDHGGRKSGKLHCRRFGSEC